MRSLNEPRSSINLSMPTRIKEGLRRLAVRKGEDASSLVVEALLKEYPELKQEPNGVLSRLLPQR